MTKVLSAFCLLWLLLSPMAVYTAEIGIATRDVGSYSYRIGTQLRELVAKETNLGWLKIYPRPTPLAQIQLILQGQASLAIVSGRTGYNAWAGKEYFKKGASLYALLPLDKAAMHMITKRKVNELTELKEGAVGLGPPGSTSELLGKFILDRTAIQMRTISYSTPWEQVSAYVNGMVDTVAILAPVGSPIILRILKSGYKLLNVPSEVVEAAKKMMPFTKDFTIVEAVYKTKPISTLAVQNLVVSGINLPDDPAQKIVRAYAETLGSGSSLDFAEFYPSYRFTKLSDDVGRIVAWLPFGYVDVRSVPDGGAILADNEYWGLKTDAIFHLRIGNHSISILRNDYERYDKEIYLSERRTVAVEKNLVSKPGIRHQIPEPGKSEAFVKTTGLPMPLHPGAAKYLVEAGLVKYKWPDRAESDPGEQKTK